MSSILDPKPKLSRTADANADANANVNANVKPRANPKPKAKRGSGPLMIASLGNPGAQYSRTLHSAGHILLAALVAYTNSPGLGISSGYAAEVSESWYTVPRTGAGAPGSMSRKGGPGSMHAEQAWQAQSPGADTEQSRVLFWKSPSYMNTCGPGLAQAWSRFASASASASKPNPNLSPDPTNPGLDSGMASPRPHLVVLHDELELPLGRFSVKTSAGRSARGHNGLKSLLATKSLSNLNFTRVGIGIGPRPDSRSPDVVARFVLSRLNERDVLKLQGIAGDVWRKLMQLPPAP